MTFNPLPCGGRFCPSLLPRGFSIIVPKLFDIGFETFWSFYFRVLSQHFSKIVPAGALLGSCNFGGGGLGWTFSAGIEIFLLLSASAERFRKYRLCRALKPGSIISYHSWFCSHLTIILHCLRSHVYHIFFTMCKNVRVLPNGEDIHWHDRANRLPSRPLRPHAIRWLHRSNWLNTILISENSWASLLGRPVGVIP